MPFSGRLLIMKTVSQEYQLQLSGLASELVSPGRFSEVLSVADQALGDTVAFEPVVLAEAPAA